MKKSDSKRAVIYSRTDGSTVSTSDASIVSQEKRCREYASETGLNIVANFHDVGADMIERPGLIGMLDFLDHHRSEPSIVLADSVCAVANNASAFAEIHNAIEDKGAILLLRKLNKGNDPAPWFPATMSSTLAEYAHLTGILKRH